MTYTLQALITGFLTVGTGTFLVLGVRQMIREWRMGR